MYPFEAQSEVHQPGELDDDEVEYAGRRRAACESTWQPRDDQPDGAGNVDVAAAAVDVVVAGLVDADVRTVEELTAWLVELARALFA